MKNLALQIHSDGAFYQTRTPMVHPKVSPAATQSALLAQYQSFIADHIGDEKFEEGISDVLISGYFFLQALARVMPNVGRKLNVALDADEKRILFTLFGRDDRDLDVWVARDAPHLKLVRTEGTRSIEKAFNLDDVENLGHWLTGTSNRAP